jgi:hypothetical protein
VSNPLKFSLSIFLLFTTSFAATVSKTNAETPSSPVVDVGNNPEGSIVYGNDAFISNLGVSRNPVVDQDGYISQVALDGSTVIERFLPLDSSTPLNFPMGLVAVSDVLYVADLNRVIGFDIATRRVVFESTLVLEGLQYFNDLAYVGNNSLVVSATNLKSLYLLNLKTKMWHKIETDTELQFVNGLKFDKFDSTLYVVDNAQQTIADNNGRILAFSYEGGNFKSLWQVSTGKFLDGVTQLSRSTLLVSDWNDFQAGGVVHFIDIFERRKTSEELWGQKGLADISYDRGSGVLVLPAMMQGQVELPKDLEVGTKILRCSPRDSVGIGTLSLSLNQFGAVHSALFNGSTCRLPLYSEGDGRIYFENSCPIFTDGQPLGILATEFVGSSYYSIEMMFPRVPDSDCHPVRLCDPSQHGYSHYICK